MDFAWLIPLLALFTMLAFLVFALVSKQRVEGKRKNDVLPSSLAIDGDERVAKMD
ncbi:hypothetical protein [Palleronia sp. LCG004]|uniref:hypothetical protein n=1 Tax=Palleronia sp. LCG004 TaxID=3079304 RepID=UPI002941F24B|nr:hypothetical protein [Palleronia sp. LCG004]WOI56013.1 hypothetical protein RVY76_13375 [Palleronia sp. LCG004]